MSDYIKPTLYNKKGLENQLKNTIFNAHDLCCGCSNPGKHIHHLFSEQCPRSEETTGENGGHKEEDTENDFILDAGDLDQLFTVEKENAG